MLSQVELGREAAHAEACAPDEESDHFVQFYEQESELLTDVGEFIADGLRSGAACLLFMTESHWQQLERTLSSLEIDAAEARERDQLIVFDAAEVLGRLLVDGSPSRTRFEQIVGAALGEAQERYPRTRIFGEMVALLWRDGNEAAALQLEDLWNELAKTQFFSLFCAYPLDGFHRHEHGVGFEKVCHAHGRVIPSENYSALEQPAERLKMIAKLQQKAKALKHEVETRMKAEQHLREREQTELLNLNETLERRIAERTEELRRSELQFSRLVAGVADYALYMLDVDGHVISWNTGAERIKGYRSDEIIGQHFSRFYTAEDRARGAPQAALATAASKGKFETEAWRVRKDGTRFWASVLLDALHDEQGNLTGFAKVTRDMTERREIEERLHQAQKMESIGQLTGGVAHDFNNLLTVIIGNLETIARHTREDNGRLRRAVDQATRGAQRAATLTQQLLAFSRRQPLEPKPIDANRLVTGMSDLLRRTLSETISIETVLAGGLWRVEADPHQLESALLNLAVNARDAMPQGGKLTLETANSYLDEDYGAKYAELAPGQYVQISVTDTGGGMKEEVAARAFEPFFTTKPIGQGTGLGLSQVYGFVKQSGGHVKIYSEVGQGTTVKIYLPRLLGAAAEKEEADTAPVAPRGHHDETILVVEDDADVRLYSTECLRELGFTVLEASGGMAALRLLEERPEIQLLFTDVGLPGLNGRQLVDQALQRRPDLKVLFTTGYARNAIVHQGRLDDGVQLLTKPFTRVQLANRVRDVLNANCAEIMRQPTALIVEDESLVRSFLRDMLHDMGFHVVEASSAAEAAKAAPEQTLFDLAIVDIGLPDRNGLELVDELHAARPQLAILVASGYGDLGDRKLPDNSRLRVLPKPYDAHALYESVRKLGVKIPLPMPH